MPTFASMEKLFVHIETLLRRHDYVIVPGLGGFVYLQQSAVVHTESIEPPLTTIGFNPLMSISDGLLAIEVSRTEGISFREASTNVTATVDRINARLKSKKHIELGQLGKLSLDQDNKIIFTPTQNRHLIPANYGLSTLHYTAGTPTEAQSDERKTIRFVLPTARQMARYAAIGIVAAGIFLAAPKLGDATESMATLLPSEWVLRPNPTGNTLSKPTEPLRIAIPPQASVSTPETVQTEAPQAEQKGHHVIVSCMATQKDADELCAKLRKMDFDAAHSLPSTKTYRVAIESFATQAEAIQFMEALRVSKPQFSDAWVLSEDR